MNRIRAIALFAFGAASIAACSGTQGSASPESARVVTNAAVHTESVASSTFLKSCTSDGACSAGEVCFPFQ